MDKPLALILKPKSLSDIVGQTHLIGDNKILTNITDAAVVINHT